MIISLFHLPIDENRNQEFILLNQFMRLAGVQNNSQFVLEGAAIVNFPFKTKSLKERRLALRWLKEMERKRYEVALISLVQEAFIKGVSTRKVERLARALAIEEISASQVSEMTQGLEERVKGFRARP